MVNADFPTVQQIFVSLPHKTEDLVHQSNYIYVSDGIILFFVIIYELIVNKQMIIGTVQ